MSTLSELARLNVIIELFSACAVEMVSPLLEQRRHMLTIDVPSSGLSVDADENRLAQVLSNLLSNAAHYTEVGGHVSLTASRDGEAVVVDVSDNGIGITAEALVSIFDVFVQGTSRASGQRGLGMGLAVVKQLTELHGGRVSAASEGEGRGTTFSVRLPLLPDGAIASKAAAAPLLATKTEAPRRVLLVDDNKDAVDLLSVLVERAGHDVMTAYDGPDALAVLDRFCPTVVVIDIGMPVMDGYEVARRIRADYRGEPPYLVALTGYGEATDRERSRVGGFDAHLVKPISSALLLSAIADADVRADRPGVLPSARGRISPASHVPDEHE